MDQTSFDLLTVDSKFIIAELTNSILEDISTKIEKKRHKGREITDELCRVSIRKYLDEYFDISWEDVNLAIRPPRGIFGASSMVPKTNLSIDYVNEYTGYHLPQLTVVWLTVALDQVNDSILVIALAEEPNPRLITPEDLIGCLPNYFSPV